MSKLNAALASLLNKIQSRLNRTESKIEQNKTDFNSLQNEVYKVKTENDKRETAQTLRDQSNVQSLTNLRDSAQKAFTQVQQDVANLLKQIQRLNERMGQVESRVTKLEQPQAAAPSTIDQAIVNSKLAGVYDVTDNLDSRIANIERLLALYENLRKAQAEVAKANGTFLAGQ